MRQAAFTRRPWADYGKLRHLALRVCTYLRMDLSNTLTCPPIGGSSPRSFSGEGNGISSLSLKAARRVGPKMETMHEQTGHPRRARWIGALGCGIVSRGSNEPDSAGVSAPCPHCRE